MLKVWTADLENCYGLAGVGPEFPPRVIIKLRREGRRIEAEISPERAREYAQELLRMADWVENKA